jgi:hypothetical protein
MSLMILIFISSSDFPEYNLYTKYSPRNLVDLSYTLIKISISLYIEENPRGHRFPYKKFDSGTHPHV